MEKEKNIDWKTELMIYMTEYVLKVCTLMVACWPGAYIGAALFLVGYWFLVWGR